MAMTKLLLTKLEAVALEKHATEAGVQVVRGKQQNNNGRPTVPVEVDIEDSQDFQDKLWKKVREETCQATRVECDR